MEERFPIPRESEEAKGSKVDISAVFGPLIGIGLILVGMILEGGHLSSIVGGPALIIVGGGAIGSCVASFPLEFTTSAFKSLKLLFFPPKNDHEKVIAELVELCQFARKNGIMALESKAKSHPDPFTRKGLSMVVDGIDPAMLLSIMETEIETFEEHSKQPVLWWEGMGAFAPTIGIIGAVLGLIHVMSNLDDPSKLGGGIATAFIATIYGLAIANIFALPMASKLKIRNHEAVHHKNMVLAGLVALQNGENPHFLAQRLRAFVADHKEGGGH